MTKPKPASTKELTHTDTAGRARMVAVTAKADTVRTARAEGTITMTVECLEAIEANAVSKGDVISTARIAGIMAAPHGVWRRGPFDHQRRRIDDLEIVEIDVDRGLGGLRVSAWASSRGPTGVEMEALTGVTVALLTIYDMAKALDRTMEISGLRLIEKRGGKSGDWKRG